eukprot:NODE_1386_length_980_cov_2746.814178_g1069_i0.p1 GENE.NODE_1386_length_980_cov_2746.814178_g1069_i0~~NODE_1386_length_980_cov_2746.814178_g1069_i0.p1  ORF type:complete len:164 (+),score=14.54 NODE_1386_length_980_cov_2746.814178_g1069_i0:286-777(+)
MHYQHILECATPSKLCAASPSENPPDPANWGTSTLQRPPGPLSVFLPFCEAIPSGSCLSLCPGPLAAGPCPDLYLVLPSLRCNVQPWVMDASNIPHQPPSSLSSFNCGSFNPQPAHAKAPSRCLRQKSVFQPSPTPHSRTPSPDQPIIANRHIQQFTITITHH